MVKPKRQFTAKTIAHKPAMAVILFVLAASLIVAPIAFADRFDEQIRQLNEQNAANQQVNSALESQERDIAAVLNRIRGEIANIEAQIRANQQKHAETTARIAQAEIELAHQKKLLGENVRQMYLEDDISSLEMLASSNDLSHFVDQQQYRNSLQDKVKTTLDKVTTLKQQLEAEKTTIEKLLADQQVMQGQLNAQRGEESHLLGMNQAQQAEYEGSIRGNNARIAELRRQQIAANARFIVGGARGNVPDTSGYPWANAPFPNSIPDNWGMYLRQCVSYTAWKVYKSGRHMPYWGGRGNANQWDDNARAAGIPTDSSPRVGDVAVSNAGSYGHVMYVEAVYGDGTIYISQYNAGWDGRYSEARISAAGLVFIHF